MKSFQIPWEAEWPWVLLDTFQLSEQSRIRCILLPDMEIVGGPGGMSVEPHKVRWGTEYFHGKQILYMYTPSWDEIWLIFLILIIYWHILYFVNCILIKMTHFDHLLYIFLESCIFILFPIYKYNINHYDSTSHGLNIAE